MRVVIIPGAKRLQKKGDFDRAISDFTRAIQIKPDDGFNFYSRGQAYEKKGDLDRAIADYETARGKTVRFEIKPSYMFMEFCT